ncbi:cysteine proteinase [Planoprotostelium fungivorum]|uniref:Cysteine proteinase n=1 Tax=Planoprotostelium fungivorum TaxID=1890364 RepID=A0A2P6NXS2_9EUKA|nr:cysteine proteinase [Planoprotostelium fungivorum]
MTEWQLSESIRKFLPGGPCLYQKGQEDPDSTTRADETKKMMQAYNNMNYSGGNVIGQPNSMSKRNMRQEGHKLTEQKGRQRINQQLGQLKSLLPECRSAVVTKTAILECAVSTLRRLRQTVENIENTNQMMMKRNRELRDILEGKTEETPIIKEEPLDYEMDMPMFEDNSLDSLDFGMYLPVSETDDFFTFGDHVCLNEFLDDLAHRVYGRSKARLTSICRRGKDEPSILVHQGQWSKRNVQKILINSEPTQGEKCEVEHCSKLQPQGERERSEDLEEEASRSLPYRAAAADLSFFPNPEMKTLFFLCGLLLLAAAQSNDYLAALNNVRANVYPPAATNLTSLTWDSDLASKAQNWVNQCNIGPNPANRWLRTETYALDTYGLTIAQVIGQWNLEAREFNWDLFNIRSAKNYTAIVWQNTTKVGCASASCNGGTYHQCVFSTRGNYPGLLPYKAKCNYNAGFTCSGQCGSVFDGCTYQDCGTCTPPTIPGADGNRKRQSTSSCLKYKGCLSSSADKPSMTGATWTDTKKMTVQACAQYCVNSGYSFAGLSSGSTCVCDYGYAGTSSNCSSTCSGNAAQICGGTAALTVYDVSGCNSSSQCQSLGCTSLSNFYWNTGYTMTSVASCVNFCSSKGYTYGGMTVPYCYCGNSFAAGKFESTSPACPTNPNKCADGSNCGTTDGKYVSLYTVLNCVAPSYRYLPDFDWRSRGNVVGAVRDQSSCGSCWAFASVGSLESVWALAYNTTPLALSEQQGCNGGYGDQSYTWIQYNGGITTSSNFPYTVKDGTQGTTCAAMNSQPPNTVVKIVTNSSAPSTIVRAGGSNEESIKYALKFGPTYMAVQLSDSFNSYSGGVYTDDTWASKSQPGHAMLIVGWGTEKTTGQDYWIIRNSWGTSWGLNGYMLWARNRAGGTGGILTQIAQPNIVLANTKNPFGSSNFLVKQSSTGKCLVAGNTVTLATCSSTTTSQVFTFASVNKDQYVIKSKSGYQLDNWYSQSNGTAVRISSGVVDTKRTVWVVENINNGTYRITSVYNSFAIGTAAGSTSVVLTDPIPNSANSRWTVTAV